MRLNLAALIGVMLGEISAVVAAPECGKMSGPFKDRCVTSLEKDESECLDKPCLVESTCQDSTGHFVTDRFYMPAGLSFYNVKVDAAGRLTHEYLDAVKLSVEDAECPLPKGSYLKSCEVSVRAQGKDCLLQAKCTDNQWVHTIEVKLPKGVLFSGVENVRGKLSHTSGAFERNDTIVTRAVKSSFKSDSADCSTSPLLMTGIVAAAVKLAL